MKNLIFSLFLLATVSATHAQESIQPETYRRVLSVSERVSLFEGRLTMVNLFRQQIKLAYETAGQPDSVIRRRFLDQTYIPYAEFWKGYVGDSTVYYDEVIRPLLKDSLGMLNRVARFYAEAHIDHYFNETARALGKLSGLQAQGTWYIVFGHGVTDMGGFGGGVMVLDLSNRINTLEHVKLILPHEINHQIYDLSVAEDTTARGLYRCVNEGFAVYMNQVVLKKKYSLHEYLMYTPEELMYCLNNEKNIFTKLKPFLFTGKREHALALASRGEKVFKNGGPGAIGYFIGYRICEAYVSRQGPNSWKDIYRLPVRELWAASGLEEKFGLNL